MEISLLEIGLVDAQGVDPEEATFATLSQVPEEIVQVGSHQERSAVDADLVRAHCIPPSVAYCDVRRPAV